MNLEFKKLISDQKRFFDLLPQDWKDEIVPYWDDYNDVSTIYIIEENGQIIGGGIVFSTCPPDILYYKTEAEQWFKNGFLYLGFIWIVEHKRNNNLGSFWLEELKKANPEQNFWLLIEEEHLHRFYQKNNFVLYKAISHNTQKEYLYSYNSLSS